MSGNQAIKPGENVPSTEEELVFMARANKVSLQSVFEKIMKYPKTDRELQGDYQERIEALDELHKKCSSILSKNLDKELRAFTIYSYFEKRAMENIDPNPLYTYLMVTNKNQGLYYRLPRFMLVEEKGETDIEMLDEMGVLTHDAYLANRIHRWFPTIMVILDINGVIQLRYKDYVMNAYMFERDYDCTLDIIKHDKCLIVVDKVDEDKAYSFRSEYLIFLGKQREKELLCDSICWCEEYYQIRGELERVREDRLR